MLLRLHVSGILSAYLNHWGNTMQKTPRCDRCHGMIGDGVLTRYYVVCAPCYLVIMPTLERIDHCYDSLRDSRIVYQERMGR